MIAKRRVILLGICLSLSAVAEPFYVDASQADDSGDGTSWATAKQTIQAAVNLTSEGDTVLVADGTYDAGSTITPGYSSLNRLVITNDITVRSVNGPDTTFIVGAPDPDTGDCGDDAVRGVYMSAGFLSGFTVTNGYTMSSGDYLYDLNGGGISLYDGSGAVSNCTLCGNSASQYGGGSYSGTLTDCTLSNNSAQYGGGSYSGTLTDCTLTGNSAGDYGGASYNSTLTDCTLSANSAGQYGGGSYGGTLTDCTLSGNSAVRRGGGSFTGTLTGCTLSDNTAAEYGGGSYHGTLNNCILSGNSATNSSARGGGSCYGTLNNCTLTGNSAGDYGGGSCDSTLNNCTIAGNFATNGGGALFGTLNNCIVWGNTASNFNDDIGSADAISYTCASSGVTAGTDGCITDNPLFVDAANGNFRLQAGSPCIDAGSNETASGDTDLDGNDRIFNSTVDIGAYERVNSTYKTWITITNLNPRVKTSTDRIDLGGTCGERVTGTLSWTNSANGEFGTLPAATNWLAEAVPLEFGDNPITVSGMNIYGDTASDTLTIYRTPPLSADSPTHYVSPNGNNTWPYTNWTDAATSIQNAVDIATDGDTILVADGTYDAGTRVTPGYSCQNRLVITNDITVISVNGPNATFIVGAPDSTTDDGLGDDAVRGVYMSAGLLSGFTITNGYTMISGDYHHDRYGGGINQYGGVGTVSNCTITGSSSQRGGGSYYGTLTDCTLSGNTATGGSASGGGSCYGTLTGCTLSGNSANNGAGSYYGTLTDCTLSGNYANRGGGSYYSTLIACTVSDNSTQYSAGGSYACRLTDCTLSGNSAGTYAGGSAYGVLTNCLLSGNSAGTYGGGSCFATLNNCTISGNTAETVGGGSYIGALNNCIVWGNSASNSVDIYDARVFYTCASDGVTAGSNGCITNNPLFMDADNGDFRLQAGSPCIDAGSNAYISVETDLAGTSRIINEVVDMGAYERIVIHNGDSPVHYVSPAGGNNWPYTNWTDAATCIQDAVDTAATSDTVLVADGTYATGSTVMPGHSSLNRLVITRNITVRSVNGPDATFIVGAPDPDTGGCGTHAVRGVYMSAGLLSGFTVTNGYTMSSGGVYYEYCGGGINLYEGSGAVSNCTLSGNSAEGYGGGSYYGTLTDCTLSGNSATGSSARGGGSYNGTLNHCIVRDNTSSYSGGGSFQGTLTDCTLTGNSAQEGGGSYTSTLTDCTLSGNSANGNGGGSFSSTLTGCTLSGNSAHDGGGSYTGTLTNCTLSGNSADSNGGGSHSCTLTGCTLSGNSAQEGGGSYHGTLNNCTLSGNSASQYGGGSFFGTLNNCIVWGNTADFGNNIYAATVSFTCASDGVTAGTDGCITSNPLFVDADNGDFRLCYGSPCIDAGSNETASGDTDLDGHARIINATVDMGACEYDSALSDSDGDSLTDEQELNDTGTSPLLPNTDGDALSDYQEFVAGTSGSDSNDFFRITSISNGAVCFQSLETRSYTLYSSTNLTDGVWTAVTNRMGIGGADSMQGSGSDQEYFKLEVELP